MDIYNFQCILKSKFYIHKTGEFYIWRRPGSRRPSPLTSCRLCRTHTAQCSTSARPTHTVRTSKCDRQGTAAFAQVRTRSRSFSVLRSAKFSRALIRALVVCGRFSTTSRRVQHLPHALLSVVCMCTATMALLRQQLCPFKTAGLRPCHSVAHCSFFAIFFACNVNIAVPLRSKSSQCTLFLAVRF